jgi:hypothetical protein
VTLGWHVAQALRRLSLPGRVAGARAGHAGWAGVGWLGRAWQPAREWGLAVDWRGDEAWYREVMVLEGAASPVPGEAARGLARGGEAWYREVMAPEGAASPLLEMACAGSLRKVLSAALQRAGLARPGEQQEVQQAEPRARSAIPCRRGFLLRGCTSGSWVAVFWSAGAPGGAARGVAGGYRCADW